MPPNEPVSRAPSSPADVQRLTFGKGLEPGVRQAAVETPVNVVYAPIPFAVMMCTPQDLEDFAIGFSYTEGIIDAVTDIRSVTVEDDPDGRGLRLVVSLASDKMQRHLARARNMSGRTGCGVCGIDDLDSMPCARPLTAPAFALSERALERALAALPDLQTVNAATGAVHAAAWVAPDGEIRAIREDVGRHNALDKLIGALLKQEADPASGFFLITSRCSFEMLEKVAAFGARAVAAISAPTSLAVERAKLHGVTLVALARNGGAVVFNGAENLRSPS